MEGDKINIKGFSKLGEVVHDVPTDKTIIVEFERVSVVVDRATQTIILPANCVTISD